MLIKQLVKWILIGILIVSSICLIVVFQMDYVADALSARAIPLAIVTGLSSVAVAIVSNKS